MPRGQLATVERSRDQHRQTRSSRSPPARGCRICQEKTAELCRVIKCQFDVLTMHRGLFRVKTVPCSASLGARDNGVYPELWINAIPLPPTCSMPVCPLKS